MSTQRESSPMETKYTTLPDAKSKQSLSSESRRKASSIWTGRRIVFTTLAAVVIIGGIMITIIPSYTRNEQKEDSDDTQGLWVDDDKLPQLRSASAYRRNKSPKEIGHINIYIRKSNHGEMRKQSTRIRFPVARYDRENFPIDGPLLTLSPWTPISIERRTRQTVVYTTKNGMFIIPPLINSYGDRYSIGELMKYGYASLVSNGDQLLTANNILFYFQQAPVYGPSIPKISPRTGGFIGGIRTNDDHFDIPKYQKSSSGDHLPYESDDEDQDETYSDKSNSYHGKRYRRPPRTSTTVPYVNNGSTLIKENDGSPKKILLPSDGADAGMVVCGRNPVDKLKKQYLSSKIPKVEVADVHEKSEVNDSLKLETCQCQKAILMPSEMHEHGFVVIYHLSNGDDSSVINACKLIPMLKEKIISAHPDATLEITIGMGYEKARDWLSKAGISIPKSFIKLKEKRGPTGKYMPSTGGDLLIDIRSNRKDLCFEFGRLFHQVMPKNCITKVDDTFGFAYMSSKATGLAKDFIGFEDGNDNPEGYTARAAAALIGEYEDESIHVGGSFALTQRWNHNLVKWNEMSQVQQETVIGRTKGDGSIEIEPKLETSHVGRMHIEGKDEDIEIVRKSLPYGNLETHGLLFVAYASNPKKHDRLLDSMVGNINGIYDRLMDFSEAVTGNYWYMGSCKVLNQLFNFAEKCDLN